MHAWMHARCQSEGGLAFCIQSRGEYFYIRSMGRYTSSWAHTHTPISFYWWTVVRVYIHTQARTDTTGSWYYHQSAIYRDTPLHFFSLLLVFHSIFHMFVKRYTNRTDERTTALWIIIGTVWSKPSVYIAHRRQPTKTPLWASRFASLYYAISHADPIHLQHTVSAWCGDLLLLETHHHAALRYSLQAGRVYIYKRWAHSVSVVLD